MATSPLGGFADLSGYRRNLDAQRLAQLNSDPLAQLIQSATQGYKLQQLPNTLMAQEAARQDDILAQQLKNALVAEQLNILRNPEVARNAKLQEDVLKGLVSGTNPGLILETGTPAPDFIPLATLPTGQRAGISPTAAETARKAKADARLAEINAKIAAAGVPGQIITDASGAAQFVPTRMTGTGAPVAVPVTSATGEALKPLPKATRATGLSETSKASILGRAGKSGLISSDADLEAFRNDQGEIDYGRLALQAGRAEREVIDADKAAKLDKAPAEVRSKVAAYQAVQKDLERLREKLDEEQRTGDIPSGFQDVLSGSLAEAPSGFFGRVFQRFVQQPMQSKTAAENERLRGAVAGSISRAIAGASLTGTEKQNLIPFTPQAGDSFERLLDKSAGLEQFLANQIEGLTTPMQAPSRTPVITPSATTPAAPASSVTTKTGLVIRRVQ